MYLLQQATFPDDLASLLCSGCEVRLGQFMLQGSVGLCQHWSQARGAMAPLHQPAAACTCHEASPVSVLLSTLSKAADSRRQALHSTPQAKQSQFLAGSLPHRLASVAPPHAEQCQTHLQTTSLQRPLPVPLMTPTRCEQSITSRLLPQTVPLPEQQRPHLLV